MCLIIYRLYLDTASLNVLQSIHIIRLLFIGVSSREILLLNNYWVIRVDCTTIYFFNPQTDFHSTSSSHQSNSARIALTSSPTRANTDVEYGGVARIDRWGRHEEDTFGPWNRCHTLLIAYHYKLRLVSWKSNWRRTDVPHGQPLGSVVRSILYSEALLNRLGCTQAPPNLSTNIIKNKVDTSLSSLVLPLLLDGGPPPGPWSGFAMLIWLFYS